MVYLSVGRASSACVLYLAILELRGCRFLVGSNWVEMEPGVVGRQGCCQGKGSLFEGTETTAGFFGGPGIFYGIEIGELLTELEIIKCFSGPICDYGRR